MPPCSVTQNLHPVPVTSKRRKWMTILACVALAIMLAAMLSRSNEPHYQGKSLSEWLEVHRNETRDKPGGDAGANALRAIGTNALPKLLEWTAFERPSSGVRCTVGSLLLKSKLLPRNSRLARWSNYETEASRAIRAAEAFGPLGSLASSAVPELARRINSTNSPAVVTCAIYALGSMGEPAVPVLVAHMANTNALNRAEAVRWLVWRPELATNDISIVPVLLACLDEPNPTLRKNAALALARIAELSRPSPELVIPVLTDHLRKIETMDVHSFLLLALAAYGEQARTAVPVLLSMTTNRNEWVRREATDALRNVAPDVLTNAVLPSFWFPNSSDLPSWSNSRLSP
jgi:HEAT repeat protein